MVSQKILTLPRKGLRSAHRLVLSALAAVLIAVITLYRLTLSPMLGPHCRYQPTCSAYGIEAIQKHGPFKGLWLLVRRLGRCHPHHHSRRRIWV